MSAIRVTNLIYEVPNKRILNNINLEIASGEVVCIMGGSGSGKTSLLRMMSGLRRPTSGEIWIENEDIAAMNDRELDKRRLKLGLVFQYAALFDSLDVYDNIVFSLSRHGKHLHKAELDKVVADRLAQVQLEGTEHLFPSELSGGMQKRIGLARALATEPSIVFYDEPTSGLDPLTAHAIDALILDTRKRNGVTSVIVSHDIRSIFRISDRIAMISEGEIVIFDTPDALKKSELPKVRDFIAQDLAKDEGNVSKTGD